VDWYLSGEQPAAISALRHQIREYLTRHAHDATDVLDAELVVQELLANAFEHAAGPVWVQLTWLSDRPRLVVRDLGAGFTLTEAAPSTRDPEHELPDLLGEGGRGLFLVTRLAPALEVAARRGGGSEVSTDLPVVRAPSRSIDPVVAGHDVLPALEEADPAGGFSREVFLRALVVQLSQAVEHTAGPDVVEDVVAQVGIAVGGQMEAEYRAARDVVGRLAPEQLAECLVRLKHAIDGGFYVADMDEDRIVFGNTRCPFGDAVRKAPALCRMTSSVFGGIAARNGDHGAAVVLEERIAVGDPGCRVVVHLGPPPEASRRFAHVYRAQR
jgi:anti-sigma regulatory factor (Ser/Thr protein kinase)